MVIELRAKGKDVRSLRPERVLLHPLWLISLVLLGLNDHVLKGAGILPGSLTGKLSDFAGLLVAPVLLAIVISVVLQARRRGVLLACHVAVGVVFSAIQLWPEAALLWRDAVGLFGVPWHTTSDPADLMALSSLLVSWLVFTKVAAKPLSRHPWRRAARLALGSAGLVCCIASTPDETGPAICHDGAANTVPCDEELCLDVNRIALSCDSIDCSRSEWRSTGFCEEELTEEQRCNQAGGEWNGEACVAACTGARNSDNECVFAHYASMYIYNDTEDAAVIRVRELALDVTYGCDEVAADPAAFLHEPLFEAVGSWTLGPAEVRPLGTNRGTRGCHAAILSEDNVGDRLVFWYDEGSYTIWNDSDLSQLPTMGVVLTDTDITALRPSIIVTELERMSRADEIPGACLVAPDHQRLDWTSLPAVPAQYEIESIIEGTDGCLGVGLDAADGGPTTRWYVCMPSHAFIFEPGDTIVVTSAQPDHLIVVAGTLEDIEAGGNTALHLLRPTSLASALMYFDLAPRIVEMPACPAVIDASCGSVLLNIELEIAERAFTPDGELVESAPFTLGVGDTATYDLLDGREVSVEVARATQRLVVATSCSAGIDAYGPDAELIIIEHIPTAAE